MGGCAAGFVCTTFRCTRVNQIAIELSIPTGVSRWLGDFTQFMRNLDVRMKAPFFLGKILHLQTSAEYALSYSSVHSGGTFCFIAVSNRPEQQSFYYRT